MTVQFGSHHRIHVSAYGPGLSRPDPSRRSQITQAVLADFQREVSVNHSKVSADGHHFDFVCRDADDSKVSFLMRRDYMLGKRMDGFDDIIGAFIRPEKVPSPPILSQADLDNAKP